MYRITERFNVRAFLLNPTIEKNKGVNQKIYPQIENGIPFNCSFKSYGGTEKMISSEKEINGVLQVVDTAIIETFYRPDINSESRIALPDGSTYDIIGQPENISMQNQFLRFKIQKIKGNA